MPSDLIAPHVHAFFAEYLCQQRQLSPQTILSCRDTFRLWLTFLRDHTGAEPASLRMADVDAPGVLRFLHYLEQERRNSVRSRNIRLAAIRSFVRFVALRDPESLGMVTRVLAIPVKRTDQKLIGYLTRPEIQVSGAGRGGLARRLSECAGHGALARWGRLPRQAGHPARGRVLSEPRDQTHLTACDTAHHGHASAPSRGRYRRHCALVGP